MLNHQPIALIGLFFALLSPVAGLSAAAPPIPTTPAHEEKHPQSIPLWPNGAPGFEAKKDIAEKVDWRQEPDIVFPVTSGIHNPSITPYLPSKRKATGCAVIIAPGGGNWFLTMDREGYDVGKWLADHGIAAFVLKYRLARDQSNPTNTPQPYTSAVHAFADAQRAIRLVRSRAQEWGVDPNRVGVMGFSAGGETMGRLLLGDPKGDPNAADPVDRINARPDFAAHIYSAFLRSLTVGTTNDPAKLATLKGMPPTFLALLGDRFAGSSGLHGSIFSRVETRGRAGGSSCLQRRRPRFRRPQMVEVRRQLAGIICRDG